MQPFGVLDRYIGKTIFTTIMMTLFMLVSLSGIIKFVDQLKKAGFLKQFYLDEIHDKAL